MIKQVLKNGAQIINFCLKDNLLGINISDYSIKVVQVKCVDQKFEVIGSNMSLLDPGVVFDGRIINADNLRKNFEKVLAEAKPQQIIAKKIAFAIPEKQVYSHIFEVNADREKDLNKIVYDEALSVIPLNREELVFSYKILEKFKVVVKNENNGVVVGDVKDYQFVEKLRILVIGVQNEVVEEWKNFFDSMEIKVDSFFLESFATFQGLFPALLDHPILLVDIGFSITNMSIISEHGLIYSNIVNVAGKQFSKKLINGVGKKDDNQGEYSQDEADRLKCDVGLLPSEKFANVSVVLKSAILPIVEEIKTVLKYYNLKTDKMINEIVLVGGSSKMKGIREYLATNLSGLKYELIVRGDNGEECKNANKEISVVNGKLLYYGLSIEYAGALGLALNVYNKMWNNISPAIPLNFRANEYDLVPEVENMEEVAEGNLVGEVVTDDKFTWIRGHKQLVQLVTILVVGVLLIVWAFWYRTESAKKVQLSLEQQKTYDKSIDVRVPIAISKSSSAISGIRARIYKDIYKENLPFDKLVVKSKEYASKQTRAGEKLWGNYLNTINVKNIIFPLTMEWLIYNEKDAIAKFIIEAKKKHNDDKDFGLRNVEILNLEKEGDKYFLSGLVNISTKIKPTNIQVSNTAKVVDRATSTQVNISKNETKNITISNDNASSTRVMSSVQDLSVLLANNKKKFVSIDDSGLKWLNVRKASSTKSDIITKIYPQNTYELIDDQGDWLKIKINEVYDGWVSAVYAKVLK